MVHSVLDDALMSSTQHRQLKVPRLLPALGPRAGGAAMGRTLLLALVLVGAGCGLGAQHKPNVVLIVVDTLRVDHLSRAGYGRETSPRLTQLAAGGVRFSRAYSAAASTAPTHASLFTGKRPPSHGLVKNGLSLEDSQGTLAEVFQVIETTWQTWQTMFPTSLVLSDTTGVYSAGQYASYPYGSYRTDNRIIFPVPASAGDNRCTTGLCCRGCSTKAI